MQIAWEHIYCVDGAACLGMCCLACHVQRTCAAHDIHYGGQLLGGALFDGGAHDGGLLRRAALHGGNQGEGAFAFAQVIAQVLAHFLGIACVVEYVVNDLEGLPSAWP